MWGPHPKKRFGVWPRRLAIALAVLLSLWALAWLAVPPILKWQAQGRLSELLGRSVSLGEVGFRPWSLELTVRDVVVGPSAGGAQPLLRWSRAYVNADAGSLWRGAPVFAAIELDGAQLHVARLAPGQFDIDVLLECFASDPSVPTDSEPARFALYNLRQRDASLSFDDRPARRVHRVEALQVALPSISSLPAHLEVNVEPHVAFKLDGAAFDSGPQATPFAERHGGELKLDLSSALVDMAMHVRPDGVVDPDAFERDTLSALGMPKEMVMRHRLPQLNHLFSSDAYSAGYYSYIWSEVMDADTWEMFEASGNVFDPATAAGMRNIILGEGNSSDRAEAYRRFRGRDPDVNALLRTRGFPTGETSNGGTNGGN